ncbi:phosphoglycerate mutase-like protein [Coniophora puteana RWD-64-598 SS2]|uniref:Phosphoglycerate mutase-like protein n=1 Tax=Coniophora puteana (strain RWD-64-598) TaxID=741705 RepID=R7SDV7_CONPW|nr:phosphoglycerate mutase-like protein [Coniophora puteana RWD-64-598 SS2]EIW74055.1 phosphoglycerate mutase-like protein [Coniophora puteana RWD-64-598 SS2]
MTSPADIEAANSHPSNIIFAYDKEDDHEAHPRLSDSEHDALLPTSDSAPGLSQKLGLQSTAGPRFTLVHLLSAFAGGIAICATAQLSIWGTGCYTSYRSAYGNGRTGVDVLAAPEAGSTEVHHFPPPSPTNASPEWFPTDVGYAGGTPTGAEPGLIATAPSYPLHTAAAQLVAPAEYPKSKSKPNDDDKDEDDDEEFNLFRKWGNLSPWYSVPQGTYGIDASPDAPEGCSITGLHLLHRHGARYPTAWSDYGGPAKLATKLHGAAAQWEGTGKLSFLNDWTYKLGEEILTPFGRQQLFDLGLSMRMKYGYLLKNFTESNTIPVFRTESQDRMLASAQNFALGFFGYPFDGQYEQLITIEADGFNNTFAPYKTCPNAKASGKGNRSLDYIRRWTATYLSDAYTRIQKQLSGLELSVEDVYTMQQMCAYETVAIGYSKFCELFTEDEWEGFNYALDISFWYDSAFGSPVAKVQGIGYVQELVSRLTKTPIETHNSSTNATLHRPETFPLGSSLYVDATHEVVVLNIIAALNLTTLAAGGPLPADHIPKKRPFRVAELAPFATNMQFQLLSCASHPDPQIRIAINDGVVPLTGVYGCPEDKLGMCPVDVFAEGQRRTISETDWDWACHGNWEVPAGEAWETVTGAAPGREYEKSE